MEREHWLVTYSRTVNEQISSGTSIPGLTDEENRLVNDIDHYPHAFVLACCMDRQISSDRAWRIPCVVKNLCKEFTIEELASLPPEWYRQVFEENSLHRFNEIMADTFYDAVLRIRDEYGGDASRIWANRPSSAAVVYRFLQFKGVGVKIATMAANILAREFGVPFSDYYSIDASPDVHLIRVFRRTGLVRGAASRDEVIYKAREICPEFPGIVDGACWRIGREHCHPSNPDCAHCPVKENCPKMP